MSGSTVNTSVSGNNVTITVKIDPSDILFGWWVRVTSKYDYGYGKGQGVGDYPYIVEIIDHTSIFDAYYSATKTYKPGLYVAELNLMRIGPVDYSLFELTGTGGGGGGVGGGVLASISIPSTATVAIGKTTTLTPICKTGSGSNMTCPLLTWGYGTSGYVSISSGVITGVSPGSVLVNCWDTVTGVASNICTVTITGTAPPVGIAHAAIFNWCWKVGLATGSCNIPREAGAVPAGSSVVIQTDIVNTGYIGKVRGVIKIDGSQIISLDNPSLDTFPAGPPWNVRTTYTMPNKSVNLSAEAYSWDGSVWVLTDSKTDIISTSGPACDTISLDPGSAQIDPADSTTYKVTMTATVKPFGVGGASYPVMFKNGSGTVLSTCNSDKANGKCTFIWDYSAFKDTSPDVMYSHGVAGYYVTAVVGEAGTIGSCYSTKSIMIIGFPQYALTITVTDVKTGLAVSGASVTAAIAGKLSQTKTTDSLGNVSYNVEQGTVSITITKDGYNNYTTADNVFVDTAIKYAITPTPIVPTAGSVQFVSVPSGASIYLDGVDTGEKTPKTIDGISSGDHKFIFKLSGYNEQNGIVTVLGGSIVQAYKSMTILTPTLGALNITSHPVMGAEVFVDGVDQNTTSSGATIIHDIPPGNHTYKLVLSGYKDSIGNFVVTAGTTISIDAAIEPLLTIGTVEVKSTPAGAEIYIDGTDTYKGTPASIMNLDVGSHTYKLTLSGYQNGEGIFDITAGAVTPVDVLLKATTPTTGTLNITSDPPNAKVIIDDIDINKVTPAIVKDLTAESHTYKLLLRGYRDFGGTFTITEGWTKNVNVTLELISTPSAGSGGGIGTLAAIAAGVYILSTMKDKGK